MEHNCIMRTSMPIPNKQEYRQYQQRDEEMVLEIWILLKRGKKSKHLNFIPSYILDKLAEWPRKKTKCKQIAGSPFYIFSGGNARAFG
ncbi:hypothetical protein M8J77_022732 [Diaphorina citri]|nr:hypothetical protein M8J77_022732 [Diaphorina citri]